MRDGQDRGRLPRGDQLTADTSGTAIGASDDAANGALTLSGTDTLAHYTTVLDSVTYSSTAADPTDGLTDLSRTISKTSTSCAGSPGRSGRCRSSPAQTAQTTVLLALKLLRAAFDRGLPEAVSLSLQGSNNLKNHAASDDKPIELGLDSGDFSWRVRLIPRAASVDHLTDERLARGEETIFVRDSLGNFFFRGQRQELAAGAAERLGLRIAVDNHPEDPDTAEMAALVRHIQVFHDPDIRGLREGGSKATEDRHMHARGRNVFTMLRKWRDRREDAARFAFVDEGLKAAFPGVYSGLDFDAGQTISVRVYRAGDETPNPISHEANGLVAMLLLLAQVAGTHPGGIVAIDEPETALHPYAIRRFVRLSREWARLNDITIVLTTHSPVLLDSSTPNLSASSSWSLAARTFPCD